MEITLAKCIVLEKSITKKQEKDEKGKWKETGEVYKKVIVYPFGQTSYPGVIAAGFDDVREAEIDAIVGKVCSVTLDQKTMKAGTFYDFCNAVPVAASRTNV